MFFSFPCLVKKKLIILNFQVFAQSCKSSQKECLLKKPSCNLINGTEPIRKDCLKNLYKLDLIELLQLLSSGYFEYCIS